MVIEQVPGVKENMPSVWSGFQFLRQTGVGIPTELGVVVTTGFPGMHQPDPLVTHEGTCSTALQTDNLHHSDTYHVTRTTHTT